jgi:hypothetical protein
MAHLVTPDITGKVKNPGFLAAPPYAQKMGGDLAEVLLKKTNRFSQVKRAGSAPLILIYSSDRSPYLKGIR